MRLKEDSVFSLLTERAVREGKHVLVPPGFVNEQEPEMRAALH
jgi:hypothetical protein